MSERDWMKLEAAWERLRWARLDWQRRSDMRPTAKAAAESLSMNEDTYTAYERAPGDGRKHTPLDYVKAVKFGKKFGINWVWLLSGEETPWRPPTQSRLEKLLDDVPEADRADIVPDLVEMLELALKQRLAKGRK